MDIAALSMQMSLSNVQQQASVCMMKKTMDNASTELNAIMEMMPPSNNQLDVRA